MAWIYRPKKKPRNDTSQARRERRKVYDSAQWRRLRLSYRRDHPLCEMCLKEGKVVPATDIHHIQSFTTAADQAQRDTLAYDPDNLMALCDSCHNKIHHNKKGDKNGVSRD